MVKKGADEKECDRGGIGFLEPFEADIPGSVYTLFVVVWSIDYFVRLRGLQSSWSMLK